MRLWLSHAFLVIALGLTGCVTSGPLPKSPLAFPREAGGFQGSALVLPREGAGPFPAVVLMHTCGGLGGHIYAWSQRLIRAGYASLIVDSNSPRGVRNNCQGSSALISLDEIAGDAVAALAHLRTLPMIDPDRLAIIGFSYGAMGSLRLAGEAYQRRVPGGVPGLRAVAFFYGTCGTDSPIAAVQASSNNMPGDVVTPTMMFLGAIDTESPARFCTAAADRLRARGQPIAYKLYPHTTHSFDESNWGLEGRQITHFSRGPFLYRYNPEATEDAWRETQAFFQRYLGRSS